MEKEAVVHVVDDDHSVRRAIASLLKSVEIPCETYESVQAFLEADVEAAPGCLLLDVRLPGVSGLDFQAQMQKFGLKLPVIMISAHGDIPMSVQAMKAGALDFLPKPFRDQDLLDAISNALDKDRRRRIIDGEMSLLVERYETLSAREKQVMELITAGRLNKQAAFDMELSEITVKLYRASAMKKMKARTLPDLVKMAERLKVGQAAV